MRVPAPVSYVAELAARASAYAVVQRVDRMVADARQAHPGSAEMLYVGALHPSPEAMRRAREAIYRDRMVWSGDSISWGVKKLSRGKRRKLKKLRRRIKRIMESGR